MSNRYETYQTGYYFEGLGLTPWEDLGVGPEAKIKLFRIWPCCISIKVTTYAATWWQMFCQQTHPRPWGWGQEVKPYFFLKVVMLHIKLKGTMKASTLFLYTPSIPRVWSKGQIFFVCL